MPGGYVVQGKCPIFKTGILDIVDIPHKVSEEVLEEEVLKIFEKLGCDISPDHV